MHKYTVDTCICIPVMNACTSVVYFLHLYPACDECFITALYHVWLTLRGRLAFGLSTQPPDPIILRVLHSASRILHSTDSLVIIMVICVLVWY